MKRIWVHKTTSIDAASEFDLKYYLAMSPQERLDIMQYLREIFYKLKGHNNENRKRLRRSIKNIQ